MCPGMNAIYAIYYSIQLYLHLSIFVSLLHFLFQESRSVSVVYYLIRQIQKKDGQAKYSVSEKLYEASRFLVVFSFIQKTFSRVTQRVSRGTKNGM